MNRTVRLLVFGLLLTLSADLAGSQQGAGNVVAGVVLRGSTNEPLPGVSVQLRPSGRSEAYEVLSGNDGRFQFRNIPASDYTLSAVRSGFVRADYGRRRTSDPLLVLAVDSNRTISNVVFHMIPAGAIYGQVSGDDGEPLAAAVVRAWQETFLDGYRAIRLVATVSTDDFGNYRLFSLTPGKYFVSVENSIGENNLQSYYGDTTDIRLARLVTLTAGSTAGGINITDRSEASRTIRGTVSHVGKQASVRLTPLIPIGNEINFEVPVDPVTGGFSVPQVSPGGYILTATSDKVSAQLSIDVGTLAIGDVPIAIPSPIEIPAHVSLDSKAAATRIELSEILFGIRRDSAVSNLPDSTYSPQKNNSFTLRLSPGDYRMRAVDIPAGAYIQSIRLGTQDVLNDGLHLDSLLQAPLEIVIAADTGTLEGTAADAQKRLEPNVVVALLPGGTHHQRVDLIQNVRSDAEGRFRFDHVPPGDYFIYSWEDVEPTAWMNSNFMKDFENRGRPVHIDAGARQTVSVETIPPGD